MPAFNNPAGRLHNLLTNLSAQGAVPLLNGWAEVLGVDSRAVFPLLGGVGKLVDEIELEVARVGGSALMDPFTRHRDEWMRPIFPVNETYQVQVAEVIPDGVSLEALALVSSSLSLIAPQGALPDADKLAEIKSKVREVIDAVQEAEDLPADLKRLLISRLRDVEEAIEHVDIGGPEAVHHAVEAVIGNVAVVEDKNLWESPTVRKVMAVLWIAWTGFTAGPTIHNSIQAWDHMVPELGAGITREVEDRGGGSGDGSHEPPTGETPEPRSSSDRTR